ncbi:alpha/beta hydrolase [Microbacterium sp. A8/3-1]|uniref:Alpha/beta hydrolase n=1 Tax=Microbacterium sp. A8/3-1 TaxID=3160749 RepID=A0AAU7VW14_9MICO
MTDTTVFTPSSTIDVLGLATTYRRVGAGEPLIYLGDQGYSGRWIPLFDSLASRFDVIVPDHPSFGGTDIPDGLMTFTDLVVHYAEFLDALGLKDAHVVGHGFGGWIAAEFAAVYPERVTSLTLVAPTGMLPDEDEPMVDSFRLDREKWLDAALGADRSEWAPIIDADEDGANRVLTDYRERIGIARVAWNPRYSLALEHRLQRVKSPAQVLVPDEDALIGPSVARRFAELLPTVASSVTISGDGRRSQHMVVIQEPEKIAHAVTTLTATES